jgi:hypothetical protein
MRRLDVTLAVDNLSDKKYGAARLSGLGRAARVACHSRAILISVITRPRAAISWSGGKDSLAAVAATREHFDLVCALTMFDEAACGAGLTD